MELRKIPCLITGQLVEETEIEKMVQNFLRFLLYEKNYEVSDFKKNLRIPYEINDEKHEAIVHLLIHFDNKSIVVIRFAPGSIVTRETSARAAARLIEKDYIVPYAIQVNHYDCAFIDCVNKKTSTYGWHNVPDRKSLLELVRDWVPVKLPENRRHLEIQKLYAYDKFSCYESIFGADWQGCPHHS